MKPHTVYQHWDPLEVCIVGRSYSPKFYGFIKNDRVRRTLERIAEETEEDYQKLVALLEKFKVQVLRPELIDSPEFYMMPSGRIAPPPMCPRDFTIMLGDKFYFRTQDNKVHDVGADSWHPELSPISSDLHTWGTVLDIIKQTNPVYNVTIPALCRANAAMITRIGRDIYLGTEHLGEQQQPRIQSLSTAYPEYRWHSVDTAGHNDGIFCPVKPGLIVSLCDIPTYAETFPDWEVVYVTDQSWRLVDPFMELKKKNRGKWWVPGEELNDEFTKFVESWLTHWVGYVEETVFDVNMLVVDQKNVICNNYNQQVFDAFVRHGITPHVINFRHRYFWDGGLHCITSDVARQGTMQDYFPQRTQQ
jgi:hypothetical protein